MKPYERPDEPASRNPIDVLVLNALRERGIEPARLCSDAVFFRRIHVDVLGVLPSAQEVRRFLDDRRADKRQRAIESVLADVRFADYWSLKWCDLLRVKAEFPINLWPNAVQTYHRWIRDCMSANRPYDQFARELLTASGSNFRVPPVNFYRAVQRRNAGAIADAVALTFMGTRLSKWPAQRRTDMEKLFSRVAFKPTAEWKEEIVHLDPAAEGELEAVLPDGTRVSIRPDVDPRGVFADWLISKDNPYFTRNIANRVWSWLMGRGIIHEPDDIRPDNPPSNRALLAHLEGELERADYDLRHLYKIILNSRTYQQSPIPRSDHPAAEAQFAFYKVRRLDAEVLIDALSDLSGGGQRYSSPIPEPFTFVPEYHPTVTLADGSITSQFLEMFGRPPRDTGLESERGTKSTASQRLYMLNSTHIQKMVRESPKLRDMFRKTRGRRDEVVRSLYLAVLSRDPEPAELAAASVYFRKAGPRIGTTDLAWALVNTKEFLFRH